MLLCTAIVSFQVLLCCVAEAPFSGQENLVPHTISYGDVVQDENGKVFLYLGPDQTNFPSMWGTIDETEDKSVYPICRQLGFKEGTFKTCTGKSADSSVPVWLKDLNCGANAQHILRCQFNYSNSKSHERDLCIHCRYPFREDNHAYYGQVVLFPTTNFSISTSFGMVAIKSIEETWKHISIKSPEDAISSQIPTSVADTLCREMGYTNAKLNSVLTVGEYTKMVNFSYYDDADTPYGISSSEVNCASSSQCIRCCTSLIEEDSDDLDTESPYDALMLGCTFFNQSSKSHTEGSKEICEIGSKTKDVCSPTLLPTKDILYIVSAVAGGLLIAFIIVSTVLAIYIYIAGTCRRRGYRRLGGGNGGPHGGGSAEDGNGGNGNGRNGNGGNGNGGNGNGGH